MGDSSTWREEVVQPAGDYEDDSLGEVDLYRQESRCPRVLHFYMECIDPHVRCVLGRVWPVVGGHGSVDIAVFVWLAHSIQVALEGEDQKRLDFLNKSLSSSKYAAQ